MLVRDVADSLAPRGVVAMPKLLPWQRNLLLPASSPHALNPFLPQYRRAARQCRSSRQAGGGTEALELVGPGVIADSDTTAHAAALSRVLGLAQPRLMSLVGRCPALFCFSPEALGATLEALAELTGLQVFQVPQLVYADPELLLQPDRLKANMRGVAQALGVRLSEVAHMGSREPSVLALDGAAVELRLGGLRRMMGLQGRYDDLVAALLQNPGSLLVPEPSTLEAQLQALEAALEAVLGEEEGEEEEEEEGAGGEGGDADSAEAHLGGGGGGGGRTTLAAVAAVEVAAAAAVEVAAGAAAAAAAPRPRPRPRALRSLVGSLVLSKPSLLPTPPQLLAGRVVHWAVKARVPPARVLAAATHGPDLLAASSCYIDRHCAAVAAALSHAGGCAGGDAEAAALLLAAPSLLGQSVGALSAKWVLLAAGFRSGGGAWEARLAAATVLERAELMAAPHGRLVRLRFLADRGLQADVDPLHALRMSDALFHITYPEFRSWQQSA